MRVLSTARTCGRRAARGVPMLVVALACTFTSVLPSSADRAPDAEQIASAGAATAGGDRGPQPRALPALWRIRGIAAGAWLLGDVALIHHRGGVLWAREARTGRHRWLHPYADGRRVSASERAIIVADPGQLTALDPATGQVLWTRALEDAEVIEAVAIVGGAAAVIHRRGPLRLTRHHVPSTLCLVSIGTGALVAEHVLPQRGSVSRASADELFVHARDRFVLAADGALSPVRRDACFTTAELVAMGSYCGEAAWRPDPVVVRRRADGVALWARDVPRVFPGPIVLHTEDAVLLATDDGHLEHVDLATGDARWTLELDVAREGRGWIPSIVAGDRALLAMRASPARLVEIDLARGVVLRDVIAPGAPRKLRRSGSLVLSFSADETWVADLDAAGVDAGE